MVLPRKLLIVGEVAYITAFLASCSATVDSQDQGLKQKTEQKTSAPVYMKIPNAQQPKAKPSGAEIKSYAVSAKISQPQAIYKNESDYGKDYQLRAEPVIPRKSPSNQNE